MKKYLSVIILSVFPLLAQSSEEALQARLTQKKEALNKTVPEILELQKLMQQNAFVFNVPLKLQSDAGPYLNPRVEWGDTPQDAAAKKAIEKYLSSAPKLAKLSLPANISEKLKSLGSDYLKKAKDLDLKGIDFSWLKAIQSHDYWNLEEKSPLVHFEKINLGQYPLPDMRPFLTWTKLRLVKGVQDKDFKAAIAETVHLGRLLQSTETLIGVVTSLEVLKYTAEAAKAQGTPLKVDLGFFDKAKPYPLKFAKTLQNPLLDPKSFTQLVAINEGPAFCAAVREAGAQYWMFKPLLEKELKEIYGKYEALLKSATSCRLKHLRKAWAGEGLYFAPFQSLTSASPSQRKEATELLQKTLSAEDAKFLNEQISNPRWPQYFGYLQILAL